MRDPRRRRGGGTWLLFLQAARSAAAVDPARRSGPSHRTGRTCRAFRIARPALTQSMCALNAKSYREGGSSVSVNPGIRTPDPLHTWVRYQLRHGPFVLPVRSLRPAEAARIIYNFTKYVRRNRACRRRVRRGAGSRGRRARSWSTVKELFDPGSPSTGARAEVVHPVLLVEDVDDRSPKVEQDPAPLGAALTAQRLPTQVGGPRPRWRWRPRCAQAAPGHGREDVDQRQRARRRARPDPPPLESAAVAAMSSSARAESVFRSHKPSLSGERDPERCWGRSRR